MKLSLSKFIVAMTAASFVCGTAMAAEGTSLGSTGWFAIAAEVEEKAPAAPIEYEKPLPITLSADYTFATDYIWRGYDLTPFSSGGNHQMTVGAEYDLGDCGRIGAWTWFVWQDDYSDANGSLIEVDYCAYYGYEIKPIGLDVEAGFIYYEYPHLEDFNTQEIYTTLSWDDSILWRTIGLKVEDPILNPYMSLYFDIDNGGVWGEIGASHEIALADMGCDATPVLKNTSVEMNCAMFWANDSDVSADHEGPMSMQYGVSATIDLKKVFQIADKCCGGLYLKTFLNYNHALTNNETAGASELVDKLWGGMTIGYEW